MMRTNNVVSKLSVKVPPEYNPANLRKLFKTSQKHE